MTGGRVVGAKHLLGQRCPRGHQLALPLLPPLRHGLIGGAIHTTPPTSGVGADTALRDAATLAGELLSAARGEKSLVAAVAAYESVMLPRGFDTVDSSLRMAGRLFGNVL